MWLATEEGLLRYDPTSLKRYDAPYRGNPEPVETVEDRLPTIPHVRNFLECIKTREDPNAPVEVGHTAVCGPHLANIAMHSKRVAHLNPEATEVY